MHRDRRRPTGASILVGLLLLAQVAAAPSVTGAQPTPPAGDPAAPTQPPADVPVATPGLAGSAAPASPSAPTPGPPASPGLAPTSAPASQPAAPGSSPGSGTAAPGADASATGTPTTTTIGSMPNPSLAGAPYTFTATVVPDPGAGVVTWYEDDVVIGTVALDPTGVSTLVRTANEAGSRTYRAAFGGSDGFLPSESEVVSQVVDGIPTETVVVASANAVVAGVPVTLTATVGPNPGGGDVTWQVADVQVATTPLDSSGTASLSTSVASGPQSIVAAFSGTPVYAASSGSVDLTGLDPVPTACTGPMQDGLARGLTADAVRHGLVTMYGLTADIDPATIDLAVSPVANGTWALWYRSLTWLVPLAVDAYTNGNASDASLVTAYVTAAIRTSPDPGSATPQALAAAVQAGWDEGTNLRREEVLNCLVQIVPSPAVSDLLDQAITANLDMNRYYGLPLHRPHNHGLLANLALIESGRLLARPSLIDVAQARLVVDVTQVADPGCGVTFEQSAGYQGYNAQLWQQAVEALTAVGRATGAAAIRPLVAGMPGAYDQLVDPTGAVAAVGDGVLPVPPGFVLAQHGATRMLCRQAGWAAGRSAWTGSATAYTFRFGPARTAHGHDDHGSVTWNAGRSVLVDAGSFWDATTAYGTYALTNAAHNVMGVSGVELSGTTTLLRAGQAPAADTLAVRDVAGPVTRIRSVRVDFALPLLMVLDRATSSRSATFTQRWHFASTWRWDAASGRLVSGTATAGVAALDIRTGKSLTVSAGSAWLFPSVTTVARAPLLAVSRSGSAASIFSVVYTSTTGARPVLHWYPGTAAGTGRVRVWWGRRYRDVLIDATGIR